MVSSQRSIAKLEVGPDLAYALYMADPPVPDKAPVSSPQPASANVVPVAVPTGLAMLRNFSRDAERLAQDWNDHPEPTLPWVPDPAIAAQPGAEGGFWVTAAPFRGYAKPLAAHRVNPHVHPVAAIEKIASDLAYELRFPVPPVALWQRTGAPANQPVHLCVSAPPFAQVIRWGDISGNATTYSAVSAVASSAMSAMLAFDTWLQCEDHSNHPGNLLTMSEAGPPFRAYFAFIDYSFSMVYKWRKSYRDAFIAPMYDQRIGTDIAILRDAIDGIAQVSDQTISRIVSRVPDPFISGTDKALIIEGIQYRRDHLRRIVAQKYPRVSP